MGSPNRCVLENVVCDKNTHQSSPSGHFTEKPTLLAVRAAYCGAGWQAQEASLPRFLELGYSNGMLGRYTTSHLRSPWRVLLGVLCIALIMVGGVVSATHTHSQREISHQECGLCVTAHMAIQIAVTVTQVCVAQVFTRVEASCPIASHDFLPQFALFSRPPPAA